MAITLNDFLNPLKATNIQIILKDTEQETIAKIFSDNVSSLDETLSSRTVYSWDIIRNNLLCIYLNDTEDETETVAVTGVNLNYSTLEVENGETATLVVTILPSNATNQNVSWISSDTSVVTVDNGEITTVGVGTATVIVTTTDGGYTTTCEITVTATTIAVQSVTLSEETIEIVLGNTDFSTLTATVYPEDATYTDITWTSSDENIVTVENGTLTPVAIGEANVIATVNEVSSDPCVVTVSAQL